MSAFDPLPAFAGRRKMHDMNLRALLWLLLPYRRTTPEEAREALVRCGISPDEITWRVGKDGSFAFGRKHPDDSGLTYEQTSHLLAWARRRRIKVGFIGWEQGPD